MTHDPNEFNRLWREAGKLKHVEKERDELVLKLKSLQSLYDSLQIDYEKLKGTLNTINEPYNPM